jgi:L-ascorbate metabolism protein UlaG (beta-lactamase superfamily)
MPSQPIVHIHYLGHASFLLQFDNGVSVLTDYGQSNSYGLNSPIYDWAGPEPDVLTFSHAHPDHWRLGIDFKRASILTGSDSLSLRGLEIDPIPTSEASLAAVDNNSYLFQYKGLQILHLADAQAYITAIEQEEVRQKVRVLYPDRYDILLMTIEGVRPFILQTEKFIDWLQPVRVIPMHYWSPGYKTDFLTHLTLENQQKGKSYNILETGSADYELYPESEGIPIQVISLEPQAISRTISS